MTLVQQLRMYGGNFNTPNVYDDAADRINQLEDNLRVAVKVGLDDQARIAQLETALRKIAAEYPGGSDSWRIAREALGNNSPICSQVETKGEQG